MSFPPSAGSAPSPTASALPVALDPPPGPGKFTMDLYRPGSFVGQVTSAMCVPASMQIMINLMSDKPDRTAATQRQLYTLARSYSPWITADRDGAAANGWAAGLDSLGYGDYEQMSLPTMDDAVRAAALQMRLTGKPAGLIVWAGDHAWVMTGFKATADPAWTKDFEVSAVWVEDPWFGRTDRHWGDGLRPHTLLTLAELSHDFVAWWSRWYQPMYGSASRYVIVAPKS